MINRFVNNQKSVMHSLANLHINWTILGIMLVYIQTEVLIYLLRINSGSHIFASLIQQRQNTLVHIIIYQHNTFLCSLDEVCHKSIRFKYLPIIEHALYRRQRRANKKVYLVLMLLPRCVRVASNDGLCVLPSPSVAD